MDWRVNKQRVGMMRQDKTRCQEIDHARPWPNKISINVRTNFMKQCLLSRTPRSQFNTTDDSNQVTRKFQNRVTPVNFSWGRPTVVWGWTDLGHQGSMSVFTRNKCYRILVLPRITFTRAYHQSQILTQPTFLGSSCSMGPFWMSWSQKKMLHNQNQISVDFVLAQPFATFMNAITRKWLNQMEDMDWSVNKQRVGMMRQDKTRCQEIDQAWPWPNKISINIRTNLMKHCPLSI